MNTSDSKEIDGQPKRDSDIPSLRLGTRSSLLARWQADWVSSELTQRGVHVEQVFVSTQGDVSTGPLGAIGGQGLFTREIQRSLLDGEIDLAVHSLKDLPTEMVDGLGLAAVPRRADCGDALLSNVSSSFEQLPSGARVGTGSIRRKAQLLHARPDLEVLDIRGNLDTRLRKLDEGQYDAIILAEAGLRRLGWEDRITEVLPPDLMLPAVGQGALGLEARLSDSATHLLIAALNHRESEASVHAERALLAKLRAGCLAPVGAWARVEEGILRMDAVVLSSDGKQCLQVSGSGSLEHASDLGCDLAAQLLEQGAAALISQSRGTPPNELGS